MANGKKLVDIWFRVLVTQWKEIGRIAGGLGCLAGWLPWLGCLAWGLAGSASRLTWQMKGGYFPAISQLFRRYFRAGVVHSWCLLL